MKHMGVTRLINEHLKRYPESHFFDYVLSSYQHNAPVPGRKYHYFDTTTFENVVK